MAMVRLPKDWDKVTPAGDSRPRPTPGAYVCRIINAEANKDRWGAEKLHLKLDIDEGEFKDYFNDDYRQMKERSPEHAFWKLTMHLPIDFNDKTNGRFWAQLFKRFANNIEASNTDKTFSNNGKVFTTPCFSPGSLISLHIGALLYVREKPAPDGKNFYWNYYVARDYSVEEVRAGKTQPGWFEDANGERKDKKPPANPSRDPDLTPEDDIDIPFN